MHVGMEKKETGIGLMRAHRKRGEKRAMVAGLLVVGLMACKMGLKRAQIVPKFRLKIVWALGLTKQ